MENAVTCSSCGASNDPIVSNCQYCGSSLKSDVDLKELPETTLLNNASEWIARLETLADDPGATQQAGTLEDPLMSYFSGEDQYSISEIRSNTEKYVNLLYVRASNNPHLESRIEDMERRKKKAFREINKNQDKNRKKTWFIVVGCFGVAILMILLLSFL